MRFPLKTLRQLSLAIALVSILFLPAAAHVQNREAKRLRVLLVLDTDDRMGATWGLDGQNMKHLLRELLDKQGLKDRYTLDMFTGSKVTSQSVLSYYKDLKTGPDEALFFYYSGHGGFFKPQGHFMAFTRGRLYRNDLLKAMNLYKPQLRVLLTDCCANYVIGKGPPPRPILPTVEVQDPVKFQEPPGSTERKFKPDPGMKSRTTSKAKVEEPMHQVHGVVFRTDAGPLPLDTVFAKSDGKLLRQLLFDHKGLVDINGCKTGRLSQGSLKWGGSIFTIAFIALQAADPYRKIEGTRFVDWEEFLPAFQQRTLAIGRAVSQAQEPEAFSLSAEPLRNR
jgi:hypothetical protein